MFEQLKALKLEGIVGKRADSTYIGRRSTDWVKASARANDDFAVCGYTPPKGQRSGFGALMLAQRGADGWVFTGRVGGGFSDRDLAQVSERLSRCKRRRTTPRSRHAETRAGLSPSSLLKWHTSSAATKGRLRQPTFVAMRDDKDPDDCWLPGEEKAAARDAATRNDRRFRDSDGNEPRQSVLARRRLYQGRFGRLLPRDRALATTLSKGSPARAHSLSRWHRREIVLSKRRAGIRARLDPSRNACGAKAQSATFATSSSKTQKVLPTSLTWQRSRCIFGRAA